MPEILTVYGYFIPTTNIIRRVVKKLPIDAVNQNTNIDMWLQKQLLSDGYSVSKIVTIFVRKEN